MMRQSASRKTPEETNSKLNKEFERIKLEHRKALIKTSARSVLGSSVIRVFKKDTKSRLKTVLEGVDIDELKKLKTQDDYKSWFEKHLSILARAIKATNPKRINPKIYPGYKWGHAAKILNLFVREVVEYKRYFSDAQAEQMQHWLYVPVDRLVMEKLTNLGVSLPFRRINGIDSAEKFYETQDLLERAARRSGAPRIWFDDIWGDRERDGMK